MTKSPSPWAPSNDDFKCSQDERAIPIHQGQLSFEELEQRIGQFGAEYLIDSVGREPGLYGYNLGGHDAQAAVNAKLDDMHDAILQLERPADVGK